MESLSSFETLSRQYLLGELTATELAAMQQDVFSDQEKFYQLCEIEDRLLEDYARGALTAEQRRRFEQRYLSNPARKRRVAFAQAMARGFQPKENEALARPSFRSRVQAVWQAIRAGLRTPKLAVSGAATVLVLLLTGTVWLWIERTRWQETIVKLEGQPKPSSPVPTEAPSTLPTLGTASPTPLPLPSTPPIAEARSVTLTMMALALRSETAGKGYSLHLAHGTESVRLHIQLPTPSFPRYAVRLQDAREQEIFAQRGLNVVSEKTGSAVWVTIPARRFGLGIHLLTLEGLTETGETEPVSKLEINVTRP